MDTSIIIDYEEFKKETADIANEYINKLPAVFMAEFYEKLAINFKLLAQQQRAEETKKSESEVDNNGRQTCN